MTPDQRSHRGPRPDQDLPQGRPRLDGLGFSVEAGTVFGCSAPTAPTSRPTVKILTTLTRPDSGQASVAGSTCWPPRPGALGHRPGRPRSGVDLEATGGEPDLQGRCTACAGPGCGAGWGMLERFGQPRAADRVARGYSGGMQRRLGIAMGLIHRPRVLFLDEPTTGLDPEVGPTCGPRSPTCPAPRADHPAHHPLPGGGGPAGRPAGHRRPRPGRGRGQPERAQGRAARRRHPGRAGRPAADGGPTPPSTGCPGSGR